MSNGALTNRLATLGDTMQGLIAFETSSTWSRRNRESGIADFTFGNPHEMPLPGVVDALRGWTVPLNKDWFGYKMSEHEAQDAVATSLRRAYGVRFEANDVAMTNGGFAALAVALKALTEPGDEVIFNLPPWFFYEALTVSAEAIPVKVPIVPETFDLDVDTIAAAITAKTRVVIVNTPHNPTGRIYPHETLSRLAAVLANASERNGRPIYILSDEPYRRIVFDRRRVTSPAEVYPHTLIAYSYGKVLLMPGQRIGYLAWPASIPESERQRLRGGVLIQQMAQGWSFPNAVLQYALADLEGMSIDIRHLERKRDRMVAALRKIGYEVHAPEGTFYLLPKSPRADDREFAEMLATHDVFVLPGTFFEMPGYFRISLTASEEMIERSLPGFATAFDHANSYNTVDALAAGG